MEEWGTHMIKEGSSEVHCRSVRYIANQWGAVPSTGGLVRTLLHCLSVCFLFECVKICFELYHPYNCIIPTTAMWAVLFLFCRYKTLFLIWRPLYSIRELSVSSIPMCMRFVQQSVKEKVMGYIVVRHSPVFHTHVLFGASLNAFVRFWPRRRSCAKFTGGQCLHNRSSSKLDRSHSFDLVESILYKYVYK